MVGKLRTAVLVVHGMGSQRPLETVRGVIDAVWFDSHDHYSGSRRVWSHPEPSGVDIDLTVSTTNEIPGTQDKRVADFHELYWAHLMSETRAVAVLLWLFELACRGPRLKPSIKPLYSAAVIFLSLLMLSVSLLAVQLAVQFVGRVPKIVDASFSMVGDTHSLVYVVLVIVFVASGLALLASVWKGALRLAIWNLCIAIASALLFWLLHRYGGVEVPLAGPGQSVSETLTNLLLPTLIATAIIAATMGRWGLVGLACSIGLSAAALYFVLVLFDTTFIEAYKLGWIPWSISSFWSSLAAFFFIAIYLALYALFLQPYLGDAARYFRNSPGNVAVRRKIRKQAVDTLDALHKSGDYDRIIVVAHSLGTVVAYDMLRAYYSRINQSLPKPGSFPESSFGAVDAGGLPMATAREKGREAIRHIHEATEAARQRIKAGKPDAGDCDLKTWLVTDFVTMGSPLTHAHYLMCDGNSAEELNRDFDRRTREREFPTCPPRRLDGDGCLTFENPNDHNRYFHHGGMFALTRWTNLYFKASQVFWGDAIGGPVAEIFGDAEKPGVPASSRNVADIQVYATNEKKTSFFAHIDYWTIAPPDRHKAPQIVALRDAVDLADSGVANGLGDKA